MNYYLLTLLALTVAAYIYHYHQESFQDFIRNKSIARIMKFGGNM